MEKKKTIFEYVGQIFKIFGFTILALNGFCLLFGESAREYSSMFVMGGKGLSVDTMLQFLAVAVLIVLIRFLFFTDTVIKNMSLAVRTLGMVVSVLLVMIGFSRKFFWFPVDLWEAWLMFFVSFGICFVVSMGITVLKEKAENKRMEEALTRIKKEKEGK